VRNCDNFHILEKDVQSILNWSPEIKQGSNDVEVYFKPVRVVFHVSGGFLNCIIVSVFKKYKYFRITQVSLPW